MKTTIILAFLSLIALSGCNRKPTVSNVKVYPITFNGNIGDADEYAAAFYPYLKKK